MSVHELLESIGDAFSPAAPIHNLELLAGRQEQLFQLQEACASVGGHAAVYGERGVGKTSLWSVFAADMTGRGRSVCSLTCHAANDFRHLWEQMLEEWASILGENAKDSLEAARYDLSQQAVVRIVETWLESNRIVFIFDEFEILADEVKAEFANLMKAFSDRRLKAHIVVVGIAEDIDSLLEGHASVARGLTEIQLPRLSETELHSILERGFEAVKIGLPQEIAVKAVDLACGLPHYAHAYGKNLAIQAARAEVDAVDEKHWEGAVSGVVANAEHQVAGIYFDAITATDDPDLESVLLACATAPRDTFGFFAAVDVMESLRSITGREHEIDWLGGVLDVLCSRAVRQALQETELRNGQLRYRFVNPLMQPYIRALALTSDPVQQPAFDIASLQDDPFKQ